MSIPKLTKIYKLLDPEIRSKNRQALQYWLRERYYQVVWPTMPDPIFVTGCCRSGTTITAETIAASPNLLYLGYATPELWDGLYGPQHNGWESEAAGPEAAQPRHRHGGLAYFYARLGCGMVLDRTCLHVMRIGYLVTLFPRARFVFVQRDGRDNVSSLMDAWRAAGPFGLRQVLGEFPERVAIDHGRFDQWMMFLPPGWRAYNQAALEEVCAFQWIEANRLALEGRELVPQAQWIHVRYEDIFDRPGEMFRDIFERLDLPFDEALHKRCETLAKQPRSIVSGEPRRGKWRERNRQAIERILPMIRPMMQHLNYAID